MSSVAYRVNCPKCRAELFLTPGFADYSCYRCGHGIDLPGECTRCLERFASMRAFTRHAKGDKCESPRDLKMGYEFTPHGVTWTEDE